MMIIDAFQAGDFRLSVNDSLRQIMAYLKRLRPKQICVDIGAGDGLNQSNTLFLYMNGWRGLSLEAEPQAFGMMKAFYQRYLTSVKLQAIKVTPLNVSELLDQSQIPVDFGFLSLDIDSFDYDVLNALLQTHQPTLICAEINEKIPPPLRFYIPYDAQHQYPGEHFYGMSLQSLVDLADSSHYDLIGLCFNNAFLVKREHNLWPVLNVAEAYQKGYLAGPIPEYNRNLHHLQTLSPEFALEALNQHFAAYAGRYRAGLTQLG